MKYVPIVPVCVAIVKSINGALQFSLTMVCVEQGLVIVLNILNLLDDADVFKTHPGALQIDREVVGKNAENLIGMNTGRSVNTSFIFVVLLCNDGTYDWFQTTLHISYNCY